MEKIPTPLQGAFLVKPPLFTDHRGSFVKTFHKDLFQNFGVNPVFAEEFFSTSGKGVIRGMHFQTPPADHHKYVFCLHGAVQDVILDLRTSSPTFGQHFSAELSAENRLGFFIPSGCAHGFLSLTEGSLMIYKTTTPHTPACDAGIRWDSFAFDWGVADPVISARDAAFPALADFKTPF